MNLNSRSDRILSQRKIRHFEIKPGKRQRIIFQFSCENPVVELCVIWYPRDTQIAFHYSPQNPRTI